MKEKDKEKKASPVEEIEDLEIIEEEPKTVKIEFTVPDFRRKFRKLARKIRKSLRAVGNTFLALGMTLAVTFRKIKAKIAEAKQKHAEARAKAAEEAKARAEEAAREAAEAKAREEAEKEALANEAASSEAASAEASEEEKPADTKAAKAPSDKAAAAKTTTTTKAAAAKTTTAKKAVAESSAKEDDKSEPAVEIVEEKSAATDKEKASEKSVGEIVASAAAVALSAIVGFFKKLRKTDFKKLISDIKPATRRAWEFIKRYRYYFIAGLIALVAIIVLIVAFAGKGGRRKVADPMQGLEKKFQVDKHKDVNKLIKDYHLAYAEGDIDTIKSLASPLTDAEESYIRFFSKYIDGYDNIVCYTKQGLYEGAYLVSVTLDMKFLNIDTPAQGLEFFYVQKNDDGDLYIDNLYSSFNTANEELEQDASVRALIDAYEDSEDVQELAAGIEKECAEAFASDSKLENFVNVTLQQEISGWAVDYVASVQPGKIINEEEEAEPELSTEEAIAQAAKEDEEELEDVKVNASNVNVRAEADKDSEKLGTLDRGTQIIRYSYTENGWSKIDFNGRQAYVRSEYLDVVTPEGNPVDEPGEADETETAGLEPGTEIEVNDTLNVRKKADQNSDKIGVAYPGDKIKIDKVLDNGWTKVKWKKKEGYIKTEFLR